MLVIYTIVLNCKSQFIYLAKNGLNSCPRNQNIICELGIVYESSTTQPLRYNDSYEV